MTVRLQHELDLIKKQILGLCAMVEERLVSVVRALESRDPAAAEEVRISDAIVDETEVHIEEECLKLLALHQPVAVDLRFLVAVLKINSDLERIGDLTVNAAEHVIVLCKHPDAASSFDFIPMSEKVLSMVRKSIDALIQLDHGAAVAVALADDEVDDLKDACEAAVEHALTAGTPTTQVRPLLHTMGLGRDLERIADHATNIAEDVRYLIAGGIVRHHATDPIAP